MLDFNIFQLKNRNMQKIHLNYITVSKLEDTNFLNTNAILIRLLI